MDDMKSLGPNQLIELKETSNIELISNPNENGFNGLVPGSFRERAVGRCDESHLISSIPDTYHERE